MSRAEYLRQWKASKGPEWHEENRRWNREYMRTKRAANPEALLETTRRWRARNPHLVNERGLARSARIALSNAVRDGKVMKPSCCQRCWRVTSSRRLHGHHHDYSKPLEVEWICSACHGKEHCIGDL